jgi:hypothetical protein
MIPIWREIDMEIVDAHLEQTGAGETEYFGITTRRRRTNHFDPYLRKLAPGAPLGTLITKDSASVTKPQRQGLIDKFIGIKSPQHQGRPFGT